MLKQNIERHEKVCNSWPEVRGRLRVQLQIVEAAANSIRLPEERPAKRGNAKPDALWSDTKFLIEQAILQNAGIYRRRAIDTLRAGGWGAHAAQAIGTIAVNPEASPWLRSRSLFALGFLLERDPAVHQVLQQACETAWTRLKKGPPTRDLVSEAHAALFAVGDCFGAVGAEAGATSIRKDLAPLIRQVAEQTAREKLHSVARAACYMVSFTGTVDDGSSVAVLDELQSHPDEVTSGLATWALDNQYRGS